MSEQNSNLKELSLADNPFSDNGALALFKAVGINEVRKLNIKNVKMSKETRQKLHELRAEKPDLDVTV